LHVKTVKKRFGDTLIPNNVDVGVFTTACLGLNSVEPMPNNFTTTRLALRVKSNAQDLSLIHGRSNFRNLKSVQRVSKKLAFEELESLMMM